MGKKTPDSPGKHPEQSNLQLAVAPLSLISNPEICALYQPKQTYV